MSKLLYINNQLVDLYPNTVIAQTLQAFDIGELGRVKANYTNQIQIPKTATNRRALGFADDSKSSTTFPYTSYSARYVENGIEIIRNGRVVLKESDESFQLNIFSGPIGFFDYIRTKKLWDLDTTDINSGWDDTDREAVRNATTGIVAPLFNDGIITFDSGSSAIDHTGAVNKHPWIYYHTVINKIFEQAGYEKSGDIFSDDRYLKLAMPLRAGFSAPYQEAKGFHAAAPGNQSIVDPSSYTDVTFNIVSASGSDGFYNGTSKYQVTNSDTAIGFFFIQFRAMVTITVTGGTVDLVLHRNNFPDIDNDVTTPKTNIGSGTYYFYSSGLTALKNGDNVSVRVKRNTGTPTVTVTNGTFEGIGMPRLTLGYVYFNHCFEDLTQLDLIRDFSVRFNVKMVEKAGVIYCKTMDEIRASVSDQVDWTSKRAVGKNSVQYALGSLGQNNYFTYPKDNYVEEVSDDYGKGVFTIANENISESQNVYESIFQMSEMIMFNESIFIANIPVGPDVESLGTRLLYLRQNAPSTEPNSNVIYSTISRSDYKVAYFIDARQTNSMHWQFFIDNYYAGFVAKLQKAKLITRFYKLTDLDIHTFDQLKPIYDSGESFIVTRIKNYIAGRPTEVELFKI